MLSLQTSVCHPLQSYVIKWESLMYIPYKEDDLFCACGDGGGGCGIQGGDMLNSV
jgi:hypothetical protein